MINRAQGTIEYLVTIAVVVVLGLVVVGLVSSNFDSFSNISSVSSRVSSSSGMISISEAVVDVDGNGLITFTNNSGSLLVFTKVSVGGVDINYDDVVVPQGDEKYFSLNGLNEDCSCVGFVGQKRDCNVVFYAESEYGLEKQFTANVSVDCVDVASATNPNAVIQPLVEPVPVDSTPPTILLSYPSSGASINQASIDFNFIISDSGSAIRDCNLIIDGVIAGVDISSPAKDVNVTLTKSGLSVASHTWDVNCTDTNANIGTSGVARALTITNPLFFSSCWSDVTNPHPICNCNDINQMRTHLDWNYKIQNDINMKVSQCSAYTTGLGFLPIGDNATPFTGTLDGNGKVLTGLFINRPTSVLLGLFGAMTTGRVFYLGMVDTNVIGISNVIARWGFGSFSGSGGNITSSYSVNAYIQGANGAGGITGSGGNIVNCYSSGTIVATDAYGGGVTGVSTVVNKSYSTASVYGNNVGNNNEGKVGGLVGEINGGTILNSFSTGPVNTTHAPISVVGGLLGIICNCGGGTNTLTNSYWFDNAGDLASNCYYNGNTNCTKYNSTNGGVSNFYYDTNGPMNTWGTWQNVSGTKWSTTDGNWSICRGTTLPWLTWENRSCS